MNFKRNISLVLASTAISTALGGAVSACPGLPFAFGDRLAAHELMNRPIDNAFYPPAGQGTPDINLPPLQVGETRRFAFSLTNNGGIIGFLGLRNEPENDVFADYTVDVIVTGGTTEAGAPVPTGMVNGLPGVLDIQPVQYNDAVVVEFHAMSRVQMLDGVIRIRSNNSALPLSIRFHCQVM